MREALSFVRPNINDIIKNYIFRLLKVYRGENEVENHCFRATLHLNS